MELSRDFTLVDHYLYPSQRGIDIDEKTTRPSRKKLARDLRRSQKGDLRFPRSGRRNHRERWEGQLGLLPPFFCAPPGRPSYHSEPKYWGWSYRYHGKRFLPKLIRNPSP